MSRVIVAFVASGLVIAAGDRGVSATPADGGGYR
jgi:hypothetical protein